ncbi:uncharacterized protein TNIN_142201, partial [Trichonephila inaurata madagascariensis]
RAISMPSTFQASRKSYKPLKNELLK